MGYEPNDPADLRRFRAIPALGRFASAAEALIDDDPESFWKCEQAFRELAENPTFVHDLTRYELKNLRADASYVARESTEARIALLIHPNVELGLVHIAPREDGELASISSVGDHVMVGCLGPGTLRLESFSHSDPPATDLFDPTRTLDR